MSNIGVEHDTRKKQQEDCNRKRRFNRIWYVWTFPVEIAHLYELVVLLGLMYLFFAGNPTLGLLAVVLIYLLEILVDNSTSRVRWLPALRSAWVITLLLGGGNIIVLSML